METTACVLIVQYERTRCTFYPLLKYTMCMQWQNMIRWYYSKADTNSAPTTHVSHPLVYSHPLWAEVNSSRKLKVRFLCPLLLKQFRVCFQVGVLQVKLFNWTHFGQRFVPGSGIEWVRPVQPVEMYHWTGHIFVPLGLDVFFFFSLRSCS